MRNNARVNSTRQSACLPYSSHISQADSRGVKHMQNVWDHISYKQRTAAAKMVNCLGRSATKDGSTTRTCQHSVYASVSLTKRAWTHQCNATPSLGGCSTWGLVSHPNTGSGESCLGPTLQGTKGTSVTQQQLAHQSKDSRHPLAHSLSPTQYLILTKN